MAGGRGVGPAADQEAAGENRERRAARGSDVRCRPAAVRAPRPSSPRPPSFRRALLLSFPLAAGLAGLLPAAPLREQPRDQDLERDGALLPHARRAEARADVLEEREPGDGVGPRERVRVWKREAREGGRRSRGRRRGRRRLCCCFRGSWWWLREELRRGGRECRCCRCDEAGGGEQVAARRRRRLRRLRRLRGSRLRRRQCRRRRRRLLPRRRCFDASLPTCPSLCSCSCRRRLSPKATSRCSYHPASHPNRSSGRK